MSSAASLTRAELAQLQHPGGYVLSEKEQETLSDELVRSFEGTVRRFSEPRATMIETGTADRNYVVLGRKIVWECKAEDGKLTKDQYDLLIEDAKVGEIVGCGTVADLRLLLTALRRSDLDAKALGVRLVQLYAARGFRKERQRRKPRW
jgi:hypothetical protein